MQKYLVVLSVVTLAALMGSAQASSVHSKKIEDESQDLSISLSPNKLELETASEQAQRERADRPLGAMEAAISSWEPTNLQPPTRISNASSFGLAGPPSLNFNVIDPINRNFNLKGGLEFVSLQRSGTLDAAGISSREQQTAYVPAIRIGGEYTAVRYSNRLFKPYVSAAILPTAVITSRSAFDDGEADFGIAGELAVGTLIHVSNSMDVNVSVSEVVGKVNSSDLTGFGVNAGVRVPL